MQVYVRLGIRLLYKGWKGRMEGARARRLLKSLSIKQGVKYDSPESARDILPFIEFHKLNVDEILRPLDEFSACPLFTHVAKKLLTRAAQRRSTSSSTASSSRARAPSRSPTTRTGS